LERLILPFKLFAIPPLLALVKTLID
jgi:hypothetical protein